MTLSYANVKKSVRKNALVFAETCTHIHCRGHGTYPTVATRQLYHIVAKHFCKRLSRL